MKSLLSWVTLSLAVMAVIPAIAQNNAEAAEDDTRVLEEVTTLTDPSDLEAPPDGELLIRPVLYTQGRSQNSAVRRIDLFFSPVETVKSDAATLYMEQERTRYRISVDIPIVAPTGTRLSLSQGRTIDLGMESVEMPGGTYVLSEVRYGFNSRAGVGAGQVFNDTRTTRSYCLTDETLIFYLNEGERQFLGALAFSALPTNDARWATHHPLAGVDRRLDMIRGEDDEAMETITLTDFGLVPVEQSPGLCADESNRTSAIAPA
ncbi:MAG: hypothetical protein AAF950_07380 [Pseudomonadota bacterium]